MTKEKLEAILVSYGVSFTDTLSDRIMEEREKEWDKVKKKLVRLEVGKIATKSEPYKAGIRAAMAALDMVLEEEDTE